VNQEYSANRNRIAYAKKMRSKKGENAMKKFLLGTLGFVAMAAPALAADLPVQAPPVYVAPLYNWSGFYIGGNGGWGASDNCWDIFTVAGATLVNGCHDRSGGIVGGQIGYRWQQPNNHFVFGLEAQGDWANISNSRVSVLDPTLTLGSKLDGLGLFTGQWGFSWDTWLLYVKGGAAVTSNSLLQATTIGGVGVNFATATRWGGTIGVGFEYGFGPNWPAGIEYDHLFMGTANNSFSVPAGAAAVFNQISQTVDMFTVRVDYRFGGAVVARY
jgi:outer membrane immunogenic protein